MGGAKGKSHELHYSTGRVVKNKMLTTLSPRMQKSISLDAPITEKGWNWSMESYDDQNSDETESGSMSLDILSEHEEDEKIKENVVEKTVHKNERNDDDMKVNQQSVKKTIYIKRRSKKSKNKSKEKSQSIKSDKDAIKDLF